MEQTTDPIVTPEQRERIEVELAEIDKRVDLEVACLKELIKRHNGRIGIFNRTERNEVEVIVERHGVVAVHKLTPVLRQNSRYWGVKWEVVDSWLAEVAA